MDEGIRLEHLPDAWRRHERAERHYPAAERLAQTKNVRHDTPVVQAEDPAGASHPRLNLVCNQQHAVPVAEIPQPWPIVVWRNNSPRFSLDRLRNHGRYLFAYRFGFAQFGLDRVSATERHEVNVRQQRLERLAVLWLPHQAERPVGLAVESAQARDKTRLAGVEPGQFHRSLNRVGPVVDEEAVLQFARR